MVNDMTTDMAEVLTQQENKIIESKDITGIADAAHTGDNTYVTMVRYKTDAGNYVNAISNAESVASVAQEIKLLWALGKKPSVTMIVDAKTGAELRSLSVIVNKPE